MIEVFPLRNVIGLTPEWLQNLTQSFVRPALLLMVLFLVISIGIMVLKRFDNVDLEKKAWNIPVIITVLALWPVLVFGLKGLVDAFNTFLIDDVFQLNWIGDFSVSFEEPEGTSVTDQAFQWTNPVSWGAEFLNQVLIFFLLLARNIIYAFYLVFLFFFIVLGPFILAKGILNDEIETFLELIKEITVLFLWQTTYVILVALIYPEAANPGYLMEEPQLASLGWLLVLTILTLFIPTMTRKFGNHLGSAFVPPGFKWGGFFLGLSAAGSLLGRGGATLGLSLSHRWAHRLSHWRHKAFQGEEFVERWRHRRHGEHMEHQLDDLQKHEASTPSHFDPGHERDDSLSHHSSHTESSSVEVKEVPVVKLNTVKAREANPRPSSPSHREKAPEPAPVAPNPYDRQTDRWVDQAINRGENLLKWKKAKTEERSNSLGDKTE